MLAGVGEPSRPDLGPLLRHRHCVTRFHDAAGPAYVTPHASLMRNAEGELPQVIQQFSICFAFRLIEFMDSRERMSIQHLRYLL